MAHDKQMSDDELNTILDQEISNSVGFQGTLLSNKRADAMKYYLGEPFGNEKEGRSHYVSRDVQDTIEWIMPQLMEVMTEGKSIVRFSPRSKKDIEPANEETMFVNHVFFQKNKGFVILHNFIKDGLINKIGVVKHWYDDSVDEVTESYQNMSQDQVSLLLLEEGVTLVEDSLEENDDGTFDLKIIRVSSSGKIRITNIPPEEFVVAKGTEDLDDCDFCGHIYDTTPSQLRKMGVSEDKIKKIITAQGSDSQEQIEGAEEKIVRFLDNEENPADKHKARTDEAMREITVEDLFIRVDQDGDGIAELRQIMRVGKEIIVNNEVEDNVFSAWSPILMPHRLIGRSVADLVMDIQEIKSNLIRSMLDNINLQNNGRYGVLDGMVNMNDLLTTRPLGLVRMRVPNAVQRLDTPNLPPDAFNMLGFLDSTREERTGVSKSTQNLDSKALSSNTTNGAVSEVMSAAQGRIKLIARILAETGVRDIMLGLHKLIRMNVKSDQLFQLGSKFVELNPGNWRERKDVIVHIGNQLGSKALRFNELQLLSQDIAQIIGGGGAGRLIDEKKIFNLIDQKVKVMGFEDTTMFINDPDELPPPQEEGPSIEEQKLMLEVEKLKIEVANDQKEAELKQAKLELEIARFKHQKALDDAEFQLKVEELDLEREQSRPVKIGKD